MFKQNTLTQSRKFNVNVNQIILFVFALLSFIGLFHHEVWLDEAHSFLLARDSNDFTSLVSACSFEGHPMLWNVVLFLLTRFSSNIIYMQVLHSLIACTTVFIICKSPFSALEKILIVFGYYILFEYNIISRNYGISALLIFALSFQYCKKASLLLLAVLIFLLANTHLFSLLYSFAFVFIYILINLKDIGNQPSWKIIAAVGIVLLGWALSIYCIVPPENYGQTFMKYDGSEYGSMERILKTLAVALKGLYYIPDFTSEQHFENTLYYTSLNLSNWSLLLLSLLAFAIPLFILHKSKFALGLFCSFTLLFLSVYFFLPLVNGIRYFGFFYLVFIAGYWIAEPKISGSMKKVILVILALNFISGIYAYSMDIRYPFSEAKNTCAYLKKIKQKNEQVFILNGTLRPAISAYSGEKYFGIENGEQLSYCLWNRSLSEEEVKNKLKIELLKSPSSLVVSNRDFKNIINESKLQLLAEFNDGILKSENVKVYRYKN